MDIIYLDGKPVLHTVDTAIAFQASQFLNNMLAKKTWEALRQYWIDTYFGLLDIVTHDVGTNFDFIEFRAEAKILNIIYHQILVKAYWSIRKLKNIIHLCVVHMILFKRKYKT